MSRKYDVKWIGQEAPMHAFDWLRDFLFLPPWLPLNSHKYFHHREVYATCLDRYEM